MILTTHYMEEADRLCERLAIVDHGRILTLDTPAALKRTLPGGQILDVWVSGQSAAGPAPLRPAGRPARGEGGARGGRRGGRAAAPFRRPAATACSTACCRWCARSGADLRHVSLNAPSLEDVYIHLTGKELRE